MKHNRSRSLPGSYILAEISPHMSDMSVEFYWIFKGKYALALFDINLNHKHSHRYFWCRGYYVDTAGKNKKATEEYIRNHLTEDTANDQDNSERVH